MIERLLIVAIALAIGFFVYYCCVRRQLSLANATATLDPLLAQRSDHVPTIVYFTTPTCAPCKFQITPMLQKLQMEMGNRLQVIRVDATEDPDAAQRWGVFSVPTMFVLDAHGKPRNVHNGVITLDTLKRDIESV